MGKNLAASRRLHAAWIGCLVVVWSIGKIVDGANSTLVTHDANSELVALDRASELVQRASLECFNGVRILCLLSIATLDVS